MLLFKRGGHCVYFGDIGEMRVYFERILGPESDFDLGANPIDAVMELISEDENPKADFAAEWQRHIASAGRFGGSCFVLSFLE